MQDERLERQAGLLQMGWGQGLCEEQRLTGSGGQPAALWGGGEPSLQRKQQEIQPWSLPKAFCYSCCC